MKYINNKNNLRNPIIMQFYSETRISDFPYDLEKRLDFFPHKVHKLNLSIIPGTVNYCYAIEKDDTKSMMTISDYIKAEIKRNYRIALTVMGYNRHTLRDIIEEFKDKTQISLRPAPESLKAMSNNLENIYKAWMANNN